MILKSGSPKETKKIAIDLAKRFRNGGGIIGLTGDLGAGKTTFAQGFAEGLGVSEKVISPTFVLIREHQIPDSKKKFFHIDLYRLEGKVNPEEIGLKEMFNTVDVVLVEWADKLKNELPEGAITVVIEKTGQDVRKIIIT